MPLFSLSHGCRRKRTAPAQQNRVSFIDFVKRCYLSAASPVPQLWNSYLILLKWNLFQSNQCVGGEWQWTKFNIFYVLKEKINYSFHYGVLSHFSVHFSVCKAGFFLNRDPKFVSTRIICDDKSGGDVESRGWGLMGVPQGRMRCIFSEIHIRACMNTYIIGEHRDEGSEKGESQNRLNRRQAGARTG